MQRYGAERTVPAVAYKTREMRGDEGRPIKPGDTAELEKWIDIGAPGLDVDPACYSHADR